MNSLQDLVVMLAGELGWTIILAFAVLMAIILIISWIDRGSFPIHALGTSKARAPRAQQSRGNESRSSDHATRNWET